MSATEEQSAEQIMRRALLSEIQANQADINQAEAILTKKLSILSLVVNSLNGQAFGDMCPLARLGDAQMIRLVDSAESTESILAATSTTQSLSLCNLVAPEPEPVAVECLSLRQFAFHHYWLVCAVLRFAMPDGDQPVRWHPGDQLLASLQLLPTASNSSLSADAGALWHSEEISLSSSELKDGRNCQRSLIAWCERSSGSLVDCCCHAAVELRFKQSSGDLRRFLRRLGPLRLDAGSLLACDWQSVLLKHSELAIVAEVAQLAECLDRLQLSLSYSVSSGMQNPAPTAASVRARLFDDGDGRLKNHPVGLPKLRGYQTAGNVDWIVAPACLAGCRILWTTEESGCGFILRYLLPEQSSALARLFADNGFQLQQVGAVAAASPVSVGNPAVPIEALARGLTAACEAADAALSRVGVGAVDCLSIGLEPVGELLNQGHNAGSVGDWIADVSAALETARTVAIEVVSRGKSDNEQRRRVLAQELVKAVELLADSVCSSKQHPTG